MKPFPQIEGKRIVSAAVFNIGFWEYQLFVEFDDGSEMIIGCLEDPERTPALDIEVVLPDGPR